MEKSIEKLNIMFNQLHKSDLISFNDVKNMKNIMGVYVIYSHGNEILYIGSTNKFHIRFGVDLKNESTHTLVRKLIQAGIHPDRIIAGEYFTHHYKYRILQSESKREAEALEHLAIWLLNPRYNSNYLLTSK
jgi:hypothetical protein